MYSCIFTKSCQIHVCVSLSLGKTTPILFSCPVPATRRVLSSSSISTPFLQHSTAFSNLIQNILRLKFEFPFSHTLLPGMDDCTSVFIFQLLASITHSARSLLFDENALGFSCCAQQLLVNTPPDQRSHQGDINLLCCLSYSSWLGKLKGSLSQERVCYTQLRDLL